MLAAVAFSSLIALRSIKVEEFETDVPVAARIWLAEALGAFAWKIPPPDDDGTFLVLTTGLSTAPAGNWQWLTYTVDRIVPWSDEAVVIDHGGSQIFDGWDYLDLHVTPNGYGLRFDTGGLEGGFTRKQLLEYEVDGDRPVRIDPIAEKPEDFVQEWLSMPEEEAWRWSDVAQVQVSEDAYKSWGPVRQCVDGWWQVRMDISDDPASDEYEPLYFIVENFRVREIRDQPRPGCPDEFPPLPADDATAPSP